MDDELLFRYLIDDISSAERGTVDAWRRAAPEHEARLAELDRSLGLIQAEEAAMRPVPRPGSGAIIARAELRARAARRAGWRYGIGLAAAAVVVLAAGVIRWAGRPTAQAPLPAGEFVTGAVETRSIQLADGTVLRLAPSSRLLVGGSPTERAVSLEGRAYFAVARMEGFPFTVSSRAGAVTVLGTRFDLAAGGDTLSLVVVEGHVAVSAGGRRLTVAAGEMSRVSAGLVSAPVRVADLDQRVAWVGNFLVFQGSPLTDVARELERRYGVRVEIADSVLARRTVKAWLSDRSLDQALTVVCTIVDAGCAVRGGVVVMTPR